MVGGAASEWMQLAANIERSSLSGKDSFKGGDGTDTATDVNASEGDTTSSVP